MIIILILFLICWYAGYIIVRNSFRFGKAKLTVHPIWLIFWPFIILYEYFIRDMPVHNLGRDDE